MNELKENLSIHIVPSEAALGIVRRLQAAGHEAVFVGGCVRDALMGHAPHDWDIATSARPEEVEALFAPHTVSVGKQFGIIMVVVPGEGNFEVATFRGEAGYADGRHPDAITFVPMKEDVLRRDFTVNALLYDPVGKRVLDFVGGLEDLQARRLRAVGEPMRRFEEDKLRVLRAIRFAANLEFEIEPATWDGVCRITPCVKAVVSPERIAAEMDKMLTCGHAHDAMELMEASGLLAALFPELQACISVEQPPQFHPEGDVWQHTMKLLGFLDETVLRCKAHGAPESPVERFNAAGELAAASEAEVRALAWGGLLHDIGKPPTFVRGEDRIHFNGHDVVGAKMAVDFLKRLKMPNSLIDLVEYLVGGHMHLILLLQARLATRLRHYRDPRFPLLLELNRLDSLASFGGLEKQRALTAEWLQEAIKPPPRKPTITGHDLLAMGLKPGPAFGEILKKAEDRELECPFRDHDEALAWLKENI